MNDDDEKYIRSPSSSDVRRLQKDKKSRSEQDEAIKLKMSALKKELSALKIKNNEYKQKNTKLSADSKKYIALKQSHKNLKKKNIGVIKGLKDEINALKKEINQKEEEALKQNIIGRSKSESATDYVGRINFLEDKVKSSDIRYNVIYQQYKKANEENLNLKELQNDYKILQKNYAECMEKNQDFEIEHQEQTKAHKIAMASLKNENIRSQKALKTVEIELENTKKRCLDYAHSAKLQCESLKKAMNADRDKWSQQISDYKTKYDEMSGLLAAEKEKNEKISSKLTEQIKNLQKGNEEMGILYESEKKKTAKLASELKAKMQFQRDFNEEVESKSAIIEEYKTTNEELCRLNELEKEKNGKISLELEDKLQIIVDLKKQIAAQMSVDSVMLAKDNAQKRTIKELTVKNVELEQKMKSDCENSEKVYNEMKAKEEQYQNEITKLEVQNTKLSMQLAASVNKNEESMDLIRTKSRESESDCAEYTAKLQEVQRKYDELSKIFDSNKMKMAALNMNYATLMNKYNELNQKNESNLVVIAKLKGNTQTMTAQNFKYQQSIQQMKKEKEAERKKQEINHLKYKIIGYNGNLALIRDELIRVTQQVNARMYMPQTTDADADLVDMLLLRQQQMIEEYKKENEIVHKLNQELQTKMKG